jgi:ubiquinone/menaquinone biosynthesis C-methylase UbiE
MGLEFRGNIAKTYEAWFSTPRGRLADRLEKRTIANLVRLKPGDQVLDIGCGTGHFSAFFRELGAKVTGIDPSPEMLEQAASLYGDQGIQFKKGSTYSLPFADRSFDLVTMITVLELLEDPQKAIQEAFRVSKGKVFLAILNRQSLLAWQRKRGGKEIWQQVHFYTLPEVKDLLGRDKKIKWQSAIHLPLLNIEYGLDFRFNLENWLSHLRLPGGAFIGILAES